MNSKNTCMKCGRSKFVGCCEGCAEWASKCECQPLPHGEWGKHLNSTSNKEEMIAQLEQ